MHSVVYNYLKASIYISVYEYISVYYSFIGYKVIFRKIKGDTDIVPPFLHRKFLNYIIGNSVLVVIQVEFASSYPSGREFSIVLTQLPRFKSQLCLLLYFGESYLTLLSLLIYKTIIINSVF